MKRFTGKLVLGALVLALMAGLALAGCSAPQAQPGDDDQGNAGNSGDQVTLVLYFPDSQGMYLVREERVVETTDSYEALALAALIAGPQTEGLGKSIADGTELISVEIIDGVAYANFSQEFVANHWGGSTGETMTIYSVVNTLTESPTITGVVFLVEGEELESLAGHMDLTGPVERDENLIDD